MLRPGAAPHRRALGPTVPAPAAAAGPGAAAGRRAVNCLVAAAVGAVCGGAAEHAAIHRADLALRCRGYSNGIGMSDAGAFFIGSVRESLIL